MKPRISSSYLFITIFFASSVYSSEQVSNDPKLKHQWYLKNIGGQNNRSTGNKKILVAIVDSGINYNHPDLKDNIRSHEENGKIIHGRNCIQNKNDPIDTGFHGTFIAGIIGAKQNNGIGISGIASNISMMGLAFGNPWQNGSGKLTDLYKCLNWSSQYPVDIYNLSFGGTKDVYGFRETLIDIHNKTGALIVVSAGNSSRNIDKHTYVPANFSRELPFVITVGASNRYDEMATFSNYGFQTVDLFAPGENIFSIYKNSYMSLSGTSFAAPIVTGAAALLKSQHPEMTAEQIKERLVSSSRKLSHLRGYSSSGGILNLEDALNESL